MAASKARNVPKSSHATLLTAKARTGQRNEASISAEGIRSTGEAAVVSVAATGVDGEALIRGDDDIYSNLFGTSGGLGGGMLALSARATRLVRAAVGFLYSSIVNSIARSTVNRTLLVVGSTLS